VPLFTPVSSSRSSLSHLDDATFVGDTQTIMTPFIGTGPGTRVISPVERAILEDLGFGRPEGASPCARAPRPAFEPA